TMYSDPRNWFWDVSNGKTVYTGPRFWDAQTGREQGVFNGYGGGGVAFSLDSETLVSVSGEKATLWNMATAVKTDVPGKATVAPGGNSVAFEKGSSIQLHSPLPLSLPLSQKEFDEVREALLSKKIEDVLKASKELEDVLKARSARIRQDPTPTLLHRLVPRRLVVSPDGKLQVELARSGDFQDQENRKRPVNCVLLGREESCRGPGERPTPEAVRRGGRVLDSQGVFMPPGLSPCHLPWTYAPMLAGHPGGGYA